VHERSFDEVVARSWTCAGRASDVEQPGSFILASRFGRDDVVVMRGEDLVLRAFYNACLHRGTPLLEDGEHGEGGTGRVAKITCPYHGWTYACSGGLLTASTIEERALRAVRVGEWQGFVFVATDASIAPLGDWMGEVPPWLTEAPLALARRARRVVHECEAHWTLLVSNFQESHHFPRVHPELERLTPTKRARSFFPTRSKWLGGEMDLIDDAETVSKSGKLRGRTPLRASRTVFDAMLFPTMLTSLQPDYLLTYRLEPASETRTRIVSEIFVHPATRDAGLDDVFDFWDVVNAQDRAICERQQRGLSAARAAGLSFSSAHLAADEGVDAFERLLAETRSAR